MKATVHATKLVTALPISPADDHHHDTIIAAVLDKEYPDRVEAILSTYLKSKMAGEKYWANVIAALLISNHEQALGLVNLLEAEMRKRGDEPFGEFYPMAMIGMLDAAVWFLNPGNSNSTFYLENAANSLGRMFVNYATSRHIGSEPCSDWVAGTFSASVNTFLDELELGSRYVACESIVCSMSEIQSIRKGAIRLFDELSYKLFRQLTWPQKQRALSSGFKSREQCVPAEV